MKPQTFRSIGRYLFFLIVVVMSLCFSRHASAQVRVYVDIDATGTPDGESWPTAYTDLHDALNDALNNPLVTEIWVAEGTYYADSNDDDNRSASFVLTNINPADELRILGGFNGTETSESQRRWSGNETILSGEIGTGSVDDNSYHVIIAKPGPQSILVDGFTIRDGNANGSVFTHDGKGGGALLVGDQFDGPRFANCIFKNNNAIHGGGIAADGAVLNVRNSTFSNNTADEGGGVHGSGVLRNCIVTTNVAEDEGGGIWAGSITMLNVSVVNNSVTNGNGGGIFTNGGDIRSSYIADNTASCHGGGLYINEETPGLIKLTNTAFVKNEAEGGSCTGGGAYVNANGSIINCTFAGNISGSSDGAGLFWIGGGFMPPPFKISNTIFWDNDGNGTQDETAQLDGTSTSNVTVQYNVIEGLSAWSGNNNDGETQPDDDPLFVNLALGDVRLMNDVEEDIISPYIDTANDDDIPRDCTFSSENPCVTTQDLAECDVDEDECGCERMPDEDQGPRIIGSHADRGAYEVPPDCRADFSGPEGVPDGEVNVFDLFILLAAWNLPPPSDSNCSDQDYYYPGALVPDKHIVGQPDLFALLAAWGPCEEPLGFIPEDEQDCIDEYGLDPENFEKLEACLEAVWLMQQE